MPKVDLERAPVSKGSMYPAPFDVPCRARSVLRPAAGLKQFGVALTTLPPGAWSSQRHWHSHEDEFAYVVAGEVVLIEDSGETVLKPGDCVAWPAGVRDGHHLVNRSSADALVLVVGARNNADWGEYSDIDMRFNAGRYERKPGTGGTFSHKDGTPY